MSDRERAVDKRSALASVTRAGCPAAGHTRHIAHPTLRKWLLALVPGLIVGVVLGVLLPALPGLSAPAAPHLSGQIIVGDEGDALLLDPAGRTPPLLMVLMPRARTPQSLQGFEPSTRYVGADALWWDARARQLHLVSTLTGVSAQTPRIDSAVSDFGATDALQRIALTSSIEALSSVSNSPTTDQELITGSTMRPNGSRIGLLTGGGRQADLTKDSSGPVSWSPDGQLIAYACYIHHASPTLCTYDLRTHRQRVYSLAGLTDVMSPSISLNGTSAVLTATIDAGGAERGTNLVIVELTSGRARSLTDDNRQRSDPVWSPSGDVIAYATPNSVVLRVIATITVASGVQASSLQWVQTPRSGLGDL